MPNEDEQLSELNVKKDKFLTKFKACHPKELEMLEKGNLLLSGNENILEHSLMAGAIAELLCDTLKLEEKDKNDVVGAAIIHDWDVLDEKEHLREISRTKSPHYSDLKNQKLKSAEELRRMGFSDRVVELTEANITREKGGPKTLPEMIMFYTDAMLLSGKIVDTEMRFNLTREGWHGGKGEFDPDLKERNRVYSEEFFRGAPGHEDERSHFDVQEESAMNISKVFLEIIKGNDPGFFGNYPNLASDPNKLPYYIEDKLKEKILQS